MANYLVKPCRKAVAYDHLKIIKKENLSYFE